MGKGQNMYWMKVFQSGRKRYRTPMWAGILAAAVLLTGCGKAQDQVQPSKEMPELSEEELASLEHVEKIEMKDIYGDGAYYEAYVPVGSGGEEGNASYFDHGIFYYGSPVSLSSTSELYKYMEEMVQYTIKDWEDKNFGNARNVELSEVMGSGEGRYQIASATKENSFEGTTFEVRGVFCLDVQKEGAGVYWELELQEGNVDEETELILDDLAACYRIDLDEVKETVREWLASNRESAEKQQDVYEPEEGDPVLEKVEGYQYMGMTTLTAGDGETECPVMAPMGWSVDAWDNRVSSYLHGVHIDGSLGSISPQFFMKSVEGDIDISYSSYQEHTEEYRNVRKTNMMPISGYEEALYAIITYEELDSYTEEYVPRVRARCFIRVSDDYVLDYDIKLYCDEYDGSTNTVIKELETAYGIDLSEYYKEEEN